MTALRIADDGSHDIEVMLLEATESPQDVSEI